MAHQQLREVRIAAGACVHLARQLGCRGPVDQGRHQPLGRPRGRAARGSAAGRSASGWCRPATVRGRHGHAGPRRGRPGAVRAAVVPDRRGRRPGSPERRCRPTAGRPRRAAPAVRHRWSGARRRERSASRPGRWSRPGGWGRPPRGGARRRPGSAPPPSACHDRRANIKAPYGTTDVVKWTQVPRRTSMPRSRASSTVASSSRVLPTPASPWTSRAPGRSVSQPEEEVAEQHAFPLSSDEGPRAGPGGCPTHHVFIVSKRLVSRRRLAHASLDATPGARLDNVDR